MPLKPGASAPDFSLPSTRGGNFQLSRDRGGRALILYFYPKDFTAECTKEACAFRDHFEPLRNAEVEVIGISRDELETHQKFKKAQNLPFELLADTSGRVAEKYGAKMPFVPMNKRITYLIDAEGKIAAAYSNLFNGGKHLEKMLEQLGSQGKATSPEKGN